MADAIRAALDAHQLDSQVVSGHLIAWCTADECTWHAGDCDLAAAVDDLHAALVSLRAAHRAHQAEVATTDVLEAVARVHAQHEMGEAHLGKFCVTPDCAWREDRSLDSYTEHLDGLVAAALAGEGA